MLRVSSQQVGFLPPCPPPSLSLQVVWPDLNVSTGAAKPPGSDPPAGTKEMRSCAERVNANLNRGGGAIISKSAEPSRPGVAAWMATLHPERVGPRDRGHDCQSHPEDLCPPPPNSVSTCALIKVWRIGGEARSKSTSCLCFSTGGGQGPCKARKSGPG